MRASGVGVGGEVMGRGGGVLSHSHYPTSTSRRPRSASLAERILPSRRVDGDGIGLAGDVGHQPCAVGSLELPHVDGVAQLGPVCRVIAEPVHSRVIRPIDVARDPVGGHVPGPAKV